MDGKEAARTTVKRTVPVAFTASESFDVGIDLGAPVSLDYFDRKPFAFDGRIERVTVELKPHAIGRALKGNLNQSALPSAEPVPVTHCGSSRADKRRPLPRR